MCFINACKYLLICRKKKQPNKGLINISKLGLKMNKRFLKVVVLSFKQLMIIKVDYIRINLLKKTSK